MLPSDGCYRLVKTTNVKIRLLSSFKPKFDVEFTFRDKVSNS